MSAVVAGKGMRLWAVPRAGSVPVAEAEATGSCWGCQPSPAAKKGCQASLGYIYLPQGRILAQMTCLSKRAGECIS